MQKNINSVIRIPTSLDTSFFVYWLKFINPLFPSALNDTEINVLASILRKRYELSKVILDNDILADTLFNSANRLEFIKENGMTSTYFGVVLSKLRKMGLITDNNLSPKIIPKITEGDKGFQLLIYFDLEK